MLRVALVGCASRGNWSLDTAPDLCGFPSGTGDWVLRTRAMAPEHPPLAFAVSPPGGKDWVLTHPRNGPQTPALGPSHLGLRLGEDFRFRVRIALQPHRC